MNNRWRKHIECNECNESKRKVVDNRKAEQSCKLNQIHWWWKQLWRLRLWGDARHEYHAKIENGTKKELHVLKQQLKEEHEAAQTDEWGTIGTGVVVGATCTHGWNYARTSFRYIPKTSTEWTWWAVLSITYKGFNNMHVIVRMHAIQPIHHAHQGEDKKQVELELNMYFSKLMPMTTNTHLKIEINTMHECVTGSATPKKTMCMQKYELDEGATPMHLDAMEARIFFNKMSPWGACTPSRTNKLGINSPPSPSKACQRIGLITTNWVLVMSCMACSSHLVSHEYMCIVM